MQSLYQCRRQPLCKCVDCGSSTCCWNVPGVNCIQPTLPAGSFNQQEWRLQITNWCCENPTQLASDAISCLAHTVPPSTAHPVPSSFRVCMPCHHHLQRMSPRARQRSLYSQSPSTAHALASSFRLHGVGRRRRLLYIPQASQRQPPHSPSIDSTSSAVIVQGACMPCHHHLQRMSPRARQRQPYSQSPPSTAHAPASSFRLHGVGRRRRLVQEASLKTTAIERAAVGAVACIICSLVQINVPLCLCHQCTRQGKTHRL